MLFALKSLRAGRSPAEGAYSEGFKTAKFTQVCQSCYAICFMHVRHELRGADCKCIAMYCRNAIILPQCAVAVAVQ